MCLPGWTWIAVTSLPCEPRKKGDEHVRETDNSITSQIEQWASRQLADYDAHDPGTLFADGLELDVAQGYALQAAVAHLRQRRGERIVGYKVGCTSPTIRKQLGIQHCVTGNLYDSERHASGVTLSRSRYANLAIEGELAVELAREPLACDFSDDDIPACVARVVPVIELHNHVMRGQRPSAGELIANNAIHAGFVVGCGVAREDARGDPSLAIFADDQLLDECQGSILIETIRSSLQWLTKTVQERGDRLSAGQIILTGSIPRLIPLRQDCCLRVDAPPLGSVKVAFMT
jgi:2-keto-4-pentenoate hydratase